jgi:hypothetical protein
MGSSLPLGFNARVLTKDAVHSLRLHYVRSCSKHACGTLAPKAVPEFSRLTRHAQVGVHTQLVRRAPSLHRGRMVHLTRHERVHGHWCTRHNNTTHSHNTQSQHAVTQHINTTTQQQHNNTTYQHNNTTRIHNTQSQHAVTTPSHNTQSQHPHPYGSPTAHIRAATNTSHRSPRPTLTTSHQQPTSDIQGCCCHILQHGSGIHKQHGGDLLLSRGAGCVNQGLQVLGARHASVFGDAAAHGHASIQPVLTAHASDRLGTHTESAHAHASEADSP